MFRNNYARSGMKNTENKKNEKILNLANFVSLCPLFETKKYFFGTINCTNEKHSSLSTCNYNLTKHISPYHNNKPPYLSLLDQNSHLICLCHLFQK